MLMGVSIYELHAFFHLLLLLLLLFIFFLSALVKLQSALSLCNRSINSQILLVLLRQMGLSASHEAAACMISGFAAQREERA